jgi:hypothetical protein
MRHQGKTMSIDDEVIKRLSHQGLMKVLRDVHDIIKAYQVKPEDHILIAWPNLLVEDHQAMIDIEVTTDETNELSFTRRAAYELKDPFRES